MSVTPPFLDLRFDPLQQNLQLPAKACWEPNQPLGAAADTTAFL